MNDLNSLRDLYIHQLKDLYSAEKQIVEALPKMAEAASSPDLKEAFNHHLQQSQTHMEHVNSILHKLDENPGNKVCKAMQGLLEEGNEMIRLNSDAATKDAALIAAAQRVEHYEIAGYGTIRTYADLLGYSEASYLLQSILHDEGEADKKLTRLAEGTVFTEGINTKANQ